MHAFFRRTLAPLLFLLLPLAAHAATLNVPAQYATIQAGVNAAANGDTVLVADGTYTGDGNRDLDFMGKNITVTSVNGPTKTVIDCQGTPDANHRGFYLHGGETNCVIDGFTVENGCTKYVSSSVDSGSGGGIYINDSVSLIRVTNCTVSGNTASSGGAYGVGYGHGYGGGIFAFNYGTANGGSILVADCIVTDCTALDDDPSPTAETAASAAASTCSTTGVAQSA